MRDASDRILSGPCIIRPLSPADLDEVMKIETACFTDPWSREMFLHELERNDISRCFVAEISPHGAKGMHQMEIEALDPGRGNKIAGYLLSWLLVDELHINNLAVVPEHRRSGLATSLIGHSLLAAVEEGATWCQLEVRVSNKAARSLYKKFGFYEVGVRKGYYHDREDAVVMERELNI